MNDKMETIEIKNIKTDPLADQLSNSNEMRPYIDYFVAQVKGLDTTPAMRAIENLPTEKRYLTRLSNHLDLALSDLDTETGAAGREKSAGARSVEDGGRVPFPATTTSSAR